MRPRPSSGAAVETRQLRKSYRTGTVTTDVLAGVDLTIDAGEFVAIMGPSGSGKTTLLNQIGLLDAPTSGEVRLDGQPTAVLSSRARADLRNRRIGYIFQSFNLLASLTVAENVSLPAVIGRQRAAQHRRRTSDLLARVGLSDTAGRYPGELSGGQQQRVAIARALVMGPHLVLADEPTGNLDSTSGAAVMDLLAELHAERRTIIVVTHDDDVASRASRRITVRDGRIVDDTNGRMPGDDRRD